MPRHEYEDFMREARARRQPLSTYVLALARQARDDQTPYYIKIGATHSVMATMLMILQTKERYSGSPALCDEILTKVDMLVTDLVAPRPRLPNQLQDAIRYRQTGFVRDTAVALAKQLKA